MKNQKKETEVYTIDQFYDVWDTVPMDVISDVFWNDHYELIKELTYDLYRFELQKGEINIKECSKRLEIIFSKLSKYNLLK